MMEWVSCESVMPGIAIPLAEHGHWVLGCTDSGEILIVCRMWIDYPDHWVWCTECGREPDITHWMTLPQPPAQ